MTKFTSIVALGIAATVVALPARAADAAAADALVKSSGCTKCHSVSAKKDGPSFKETAAKYKGQADAEAKLVAHLTTNPKITGTDETHPSLKTKDDAAVKNVVQWILAQ